MEIILHRANKIGQWMAAHNFGWGIEVDIRTHLGKLYIAHDPIDQEYDWMLSFHTLCEFAQNYPGTIILDIKETGLIKQVPVYTHHQTNGPEAYYNQFACTDLIVPDQLLAKDMGIRTLSRRSIYEDINTDAYKPQEALSYYYRTLATSEYWIDYVSSPADLAPYANIATQSYVVSPELHNHGLRHTLTDEFIKAVVQMNFRGVCTDYPEAYASSA